MSTLQNIALAPDTIKVRWQEPYITAGLNQKAIATAPRGVVAGFSVQPGTGYTVTIVPDPVLGLSVANVLETTAGTFVLTLLQSAPLYVDLTSQAGLTVYIVLDAQYAVGSVSAAQLKVVDSLDPDFVILAKVNVPASPIPGGPITTAHINLGYATLSGDSLTTEARAPANLINNGSFERDEINLSPRGWSVYAPIGGALNPTVVNTVAKSGSQSLRLNSGVAVSAGYACTPISMQPGQTARVSLWLRSTPSDPIVLGFGAQCYVCYLDANYDELATTLVEGAFLGGSTTFERRAVAATAPAGTQYAQVVVSFYNCAGTLYVDDVEFVTRVPDSLAQSAVFSGQVADVYHTHTAAGMSYAGGPAWADGTLNSGAGYPSTIEAQFDKILTDLGITSGVGASKISYTPVTPVDLAGIVRVDTALNTLDDLKAGINIANFFTRTNTFTALTGAGIVSTGSGAAGIVSTGSGAAGGIEAYGGGASGTGVSGLGGLPNGVGVWGDGRGNADGVRGVGSAGNGVHGIGGTAGSGVYGESAYSGLYGVAGRTTSALGTAILADATVGGRGIFVNTNNTGVGVDVSSGNASAFRAYNESGDGTIDLQNGDGGPALTAIGGHSHGNFVARIETLGPTAGGAALLLVGNEGRALNAVVIDAETAIYAEGKLGNAIRGYNESGAFTIEANNGDGGPALGASGGFGYGDYVVKFENVSHGGGSGRLLWLDAGDLTTGLDIAGSTGTGANITTTTGLGMQITVGNARGLRIDTGGLSTSSGIYVDSGSGTGYYGYSDVNPVMQLDSDSASYGAFIKSYSSGYPLRVEAVSNPKVIEVIGPTIGNNVAAHNSINKSNLIRAWIQIDDLASPAVASNHSFSIASVTATNVGRVTVTFTTGTMPTNGYVPIVSITKVQPGLDTFRPYWVTRTQTTAVWACDIVNEGVLFDLTTGKFGLHVVFVGVSAQF